MFHSLIPARSGSKGIPNKNINYIAGKPLICWTISASLGVSRISTTSVSTNCTNISDISIKAGATIPYIRPSHLATDTASSIDVVLDFLSRVGDIQYLILLQPTSPLRNSQHIDAAIDLFLEDPIRPLVSVTPFQHSISSLQVSNSDNTLSPFFASSNILRRQDSPSLYLLNGAIYIASREFLLAHHSFLVGAVPFIMSHEASIDIDNYFDWSVAEHFLRQLS